MIGEVKLSDENCDDVAAKIAQGYPDMNTALSSTKSGNVILYGGESGALGYGAFYLFKDTWGQYYRQGMMEADAEGTEYYVFVPENIEIVRTVGSITLRG
ncbi:MAG: hypothetical protein J6U19_02545 [Oscillospiraceae bacterium]|nr:hypothetical protein [Oscillospiraceae bacterium]